MGVHRQTKEPQDWQEGLARCDSWVQKDTTEWLNWTELNWKFTKTQSLMHKQGLGRELRVSLLLTYLILDTILQRRQCLFVCSVAEKWGCRKHPAQSPKLVNYGGRTESSHRPQKHTSSEKLRTFLQGEFSSSQRWKAVVLIAYLNKHTSKQFHLMDIYGVFSLGKLTW